MTEEIYKGFAAWLDEVLSSELPEKVEALNFNIYDDGDSYWSAELVGAGFYNDEDDDWACDEVFVTRENPYEITMDAPDDEVFGVFVDCAKKYLGEGSYAAKMKQYTVVGMGFVDGDIEIIYKS